MAIAITEDHRELATVARAFLVDHDAVVEAVNDGFASVGTALVFVRCLTIAGGTSEIVRSQIGERILGLPRDPLVG